MARDTELNIDPILELFLLVSGYYDNYVIACNHSYDTRDYYDDIASAFNWEYSPQGHGYWNNVRHKFEIYKSQL